MFEGRLTKAGGDACAPGHTKQAGTPAHPDDLQITKDDIKQAGTPAHLDMCQ